MHRLGDEFLDFTQLPQSTANEARLLFGRDADGAWQQSADHIEETPPYLQHRRSADPRPPISPGR